jgi:DNA processing protein
MNETAAAIQLMLTPGLGKRSLARIVDRAARQGLSLSDITDSEGETLALDLGIEKSVAALISEQAAAAGEAASLLDQSGATMLLPWHSDYPPRLVESLDGGAPPVLFGFGNFAVTDALQVAICGSRKPGPVTLNAVGNLATKLASRHATVVSGYAQGVDLAAHTAALQAGGQTIFVLPTGILNFQLRTVLRELVDESNSLALSEFQPRAGWTIYNAMQRNRTICGLVDSVVAAGVGDKGGTREAARTALKLGVPLFVLRVPGEAVSELAERNLIANGASAIEVNDSGEIEPEVLSDLLSQAEDSQLRLFDRDEQ